MFLFLLMPLFLIVYFKFRLVTFSLEHVRFSYLDENKVELLYFIFLVFLLFALGTEGECCLSAKKLKLSL